MAIKEGKNFIKEILGSCDIKIDKVTNIKIEANPNDLVTMTITKLITEEQSKKIQKILEVPVKDIDTRSEIKTI